MNAEYEEHHKETMLPYVAHEITIAGLSESYLDRYQTKEEKEIVECVAFVLWYQTNQ